MINSVKKDLYKNFISKFIAVFLCTLFLFTAVACNEEDDRTLTLSQAEITIVIGESYTLTATSPYDGPIYWSSSDETVVKVEDGVITGTGVGVATVTCNNGYSLKNCEVTVLKKIPELLPTVEIGDYSDYMLVWSDEFDGNALDETKWEYNIGIRDYYGESVGPKYWGNNELQYYTRENLSVSDGVMTITAKKEEMEDREYTSSRILTRNLASFTFGFIEAKMQTPAQNGMWPAFWMLPEPSSSNSSHNEYGGWAANGEIDIMEARGRLGNKVDCTVHFGGYTPDNRHTGITATLSSSTEEWHVYGLEWTADYLRWFIDGNSVLTLQNSQWWSVASDAPSAPFDKPFYILFDLAVGGNYDGGIKPAKNFTSADMKVDYVRVFQLPVIQ